MRIWKRLVAFMKRFMFISDEDFWDMVKRDGIAAGLIEEHPRK